MDNTERKWELAAKDVSSNVKHMWGTKRADKCCFSVSGDLDIDLWPWPSTSSEWGTKHVFLVNLLQISLAVPEITAENAVFCLWWPWPLTSDHDIQGRPSEGPNMSSLWIWHKSIVPKIFHTQKKSHRQCQKQNLMQCTACGKYDITGSSFWEIMTKVEWILITEAVHWWYICVSYYSRTHNSHHVSGWLLFIDRDCLLCLKLVADDATKKCFNLISSSSEFTSSVVIFGQTVTSSITGSLSRL